MDITHLIEPQVICLDLRATTKQEVFNELVEMLDNAGKLEDKSLFMDDLWQREEIANTGFEDGIAIPHAKSRAVKTPTVAIGISQAGIDYGAEDGELSNLFFMLASPAENDKQHIEVLAQLSTKLIDPSFIVRLRQAQSAEQAYKIVTEEQITPSADQEVALDQTPIETATRWQQKVQVTKSHLLYGTSHMLPFIVAGGVLLSLSIMLSGHIGQPEQGFLADVARMGIAGLTLFTTVLAGYIAYSIADKPGLAPGMIGGWIGVNDYNTGFIGAIIIGFIAGLTVHGLKQIQLPTHLKSVGSIFLYPLVGTFITCGAVMWLIGGPIALVMSGLDGWLSEIAGTGKVFLGTVLGAMTAFDMGGPINKVATLFAQTQVNTQPWLMGGVAIAICTPPLGMALATWIAPNKFKRDERQAGKAAGIMGMIGISEGAIPFAISDPARVLPAIVAGGIVGNVIGFAFQVINHAPWGGLIVLPVVDGKFGYLLGIAIGAFTTAAIVVSLKKTVANEDSEPRYYTANRLTKEGQAQVLAVTACPSGVAHTFLAAKSLENAALELGIPIKIETQGANGIENRITDKDIRNAHLVIFAHDVAIKQPERFANLTVVDVTTKEALINPGNLLTSFRKS
ncbi:fructose-specific PTS transporter subunit EIIC [Vibrio sp. SCSIO 43136]|uniref:fructose-specific PTS transporter subunit EIIC n=1 Tax=Vibrio sp. SCSIO 43136 TaxID=2819101 RepID=UPI002075B575|nr:fructose-specific PTS transporter subunit EIIC [Vibrio sp. SCSIO 43136]USD67389.1 PTS sugar transporter subunit IIA [Vibrio sp. SCSIO 43136]